MVPVSKTAEFFGFFNMIGKFAAFLGPLLLALTPRLVPGADARDGILSLVLLFGIGALLLWRVDIAAGVHAARAMDAQKTI
jgi:UMF1 family MFS transporter